MSSAFRFLRRSFCTTNVSLSQYGRVDYTGYNKFTAIIGCGIASYGLYSCQCHAEVERPTLNKIHSSNIINPDVDIVFIHGLSGDPVDTWTLNTNDVNQTYLPELVKNDPDLKSISKRIWSYGYPNSKFSGTSTTPMNLENTSKAFFEKILHSEMGHVTNFNPIIFVSHSFGGIVAKQAIVEGKEYIDKGPSNKQEIDLLKRFQGYFFYATPDRGSELANHFSKIPIIHSKTIKELTTEAGNTKLRHLYKKFIEWATQHEMKFVNIHEDKKESKFGVGAVIVSQHPFEHTLEKSITVGHSHTQVCKADGYEDERYEPLRAYIKKRMKAIKQRKRKGECENFVVIIGESQTGKSWTVCSLAHITGDERAKLVGDGTRTSKTTIPKVYECDFKENKIKLNIMDTPGFLDTKQRWDDKMITKSIANSMIKARESQRDIDAILLSESLIGDREQLHENIKRLCVIFGPNVMKSIVVVALKPDAAKRANPKEYTKSIDSIQSICIENSLPLLIYESKSESIYTENSKFVDQLKILINEKLEPYKLDDIADLAEILRKRAKEMYEEDDEYTTVTTTYQTVRKSENRRYGFFGPHERIYDTHTKEERVRIDYDEAKYMKKAAEEWEQKIIDRLREK
eukprot:245881_1